MVQLIGITAHRLKTALTDRQSTESLLMKEWMFSNNYVSSIAGVDPDDINPFVAKLVHPKTVIQTNGENDYRYVKNIVFLFRRRGATYCERIPLPHHHAGDYIEYHRRIDKMWNQIVEWVMSGEIDKDDDIVIYRTGGGGDRANRIHNRYPLRLKDNTYGFMAGLPEYLQACYSKIEGDEDLPANQPSFAEFCNDSIYKGRNNNTPRHRRRFFYEGQPFLKRARILYQYFSLINYDIISMCEENGWGNPRMSMLLWHGGQIKVWESTASPNNSPDNFALLEYDNRIKIHLSTTDYDFDARDGTFKCRS